MSPSMRPSPAVNATVWTIRVRRKYSTVKHAYQHFFFCLRRTKFWRRDKFLEQMEIYPNENQMINAKRIFFLWICSKFFNLTSWNEFSSSILFSLLKWRTFLLVESYISSKDEDSALGLKILLKKAFVGYLP